MKYNTIEIEERRARNERSLLQLPTKEWQWMNIYERILPNFWVVIQQVQNQAQAQKTLDKLPASTYRSRWKIRPRYQRRRWKYRTSQLIKLF